jgi:hypothetical protein
MVGIPALLLQRVPVALIEVAPGHTSQFTVTARDKTPSSKYCQGGVLEQFRLVAENESGESLLHRAPR